MIETLLFAPFGVDGNFSLYNIGFSICPGNWSLQGADANTLGPEIGEKLTGMQSFFNTQNAQSFTEGRFSLKNGGAFLQKYDAHTPSIFLGLFICATKNIGFREFKENWATVTITGDIKYNPVSAAITLKDVKDIDKKFLAVKELAQSNKEQNHLFIYISDDKDKIKEDKTENIEIKHFSSTDSVFEVLEFVFELPPIEVDKFEDEKQKELVEYLGGLPYIRTDCFNGIEKDILMNNAFNKERKGYLIYGEGETGKSALSCAIAKCLVRNKKIYAPLLIKIDNMIFNENDISALNQKENKIENYIKSKIIELISHDDMQISIQTLIEKQYLIILDNLELNSDDLNRLLTIFSDIISTCRKNKPYLIVTSRIDCADTDLLKDFSLISIKPSEMNIDNISCLIDNVSSKRKYEDIIKANKTSLLYKDFLNQLHMSYKAYPGLIKTILPLLEYETIESLTESVKRFCVLEEKIQTRQERIYKAAFSFLDKHAQRILFAMLSLGFPDELKEQNEIFDRISLFYAYPKNEETKKCLNNALRSMINSNLIYIYKEAGKNKYGIKSLPYLMFMFSDAYKGNLYESGKYERDIMILSEWKLHVALLNDQSYAVVKNILDEYKLSNLCVDNEYILTAAESITNPDKLDLLIEYGCDINYKDEDGLSAFISAAMRNSNTSVLEWFFDKKKNVDAKVKYLGNNALHLAAAYNRNPKIIQVLIDQGFNIDEKSDEGLTPFLFAVKYNPCLDVLEYFAAKSNFDIDMCYHIKVNPKKDYDMFNEDDDFNEFLEDETDEDEHIDKDSYRFIRNSAAYTDDEDTEVEFPLVFFSIFNSNINIFKWFLEHNAKIVKAANGKTLFNAIARIKSNTEYFELLEKYTNIHETGTYGQTALHCASFFNESLPIFDWLMEHDFDIHAIAYNNSTAFKFAVAYNKNTEILDWFLENGVSFDENESREGFQYYPIENYFYAALCNNKERKIFDWFLQHGADINCKYDEDSLLRLVADECENTDTLIWMLENGANTECLDADERTALSYLQERTDWELIQRLKKSERVK